jgi:hypothetical protein
MFLDARQRTIAIGQDPDVGRPDVLSAAMSPAAVLSATFGLKQIA